MKLLLLCCSVSLLATEMMAQPAIQWQKTIGGSAGDYVRNILPTLDSGYILIGTTNSNDGDISENHGGSDCLVVKLNHSGDIQWEKTLGGTMEDVGRSIQQTTDGGYILTVGTYSEDGDVSGNHGNGDIWVVKLDEIGEIQWQKTLGGSQYDFATTIEQTTDGGFVLAGWSGSNDGDVSGHHGGPYASDVLVMKLDESGELSWQKSLGGNDSDNAHSIHQTSDGGYIVAGQTTSNDGDVVGYHESIDSWILKLNGDGEIIWQNPLGGSWDEILYSVQESSDGGYVATGFSRSYDGDLATMPTYGGATTIAVIKLSFAGVLQWKKMLGGSSEDEGRCIQPTPEGGFIVGGWSYSPDNDVSGNHPGSMDYWVIKLSQSGSIQWEKSFGGSNSDELRWVQPTNDGGFIMSGFSSSTDGDVSGGNHGQEDIWLVKI